MTISKLMCVCIHKLVVCMLVYLSVSVYVSFSEGWIQWFSYV